MTLHPCALTELGNLAYEYARGVLSPSGHPVLQVRIMGAISNRDAGDPYGLASVRIIAGLQAWQPWAVILDFQNLDYEWGDGMEGVILTPQRWYQPFYPERKLFVGDSMPREFPIAIIVSPSNRDSFESLLRDYMKKDPRELLFLDVPDALRALETGLEGVAGV